MPDFTVRADHIDVEQIMRQIRTRIRDKRGVDYTEAEIRELASVKLDRFLDPRAVRSDLLAHFKRQHQPEPETWPALYAFDSELVYESSRGAVGGLLRLIRRLLNPVLKLFINPGPVLHVLHMQGAINQKFQELLERNSRRRDELDALNFEMFNNLVVEATRLGIEVKNLRMQVESLSTRLDFDERRARALEGVVQYRPGPPVAAPATEEADEEPADAGGEGRSARRRRRRRGRRRGQGPGESGTGESASGESVGGAADATTEPEDERAGAIEAPAASEDSGLVAAYDLPSAPAPSADPAPSPESEPPRPGTAEPSES